MFCLNGIFQNSLRGIGMSRLFSLRGGGGHRYDIRRVWTGGAHNITISSHITKMLFFLSTLKHCISKKTIVEMFLDL